MLEELGAVLYSGPYFASAVLAANALLACGDDQAKRDLLPGIAAGETVATLAFTEDDGSWDVDATGLAAKQSDDGWVLDGHKNFVLAGHTADLLLVAGRTAAGLSLFAVDAGAAGLTRTALAKYGPEYSTAPSSSSTMACSVNVKPAPPYSSGIAMPGRPSCSEPCAHTAAS